MSARADVLESIGRATWILGGVKFASPEDFARAVDAVAAYVRGEKPNPAAEPAVVPATCRSCGRHMVGERCPTVAPPALGDDAEPAAPLGVLLERAVKLAEEALRQGQMPTWWDLQCEALLRNAADYARVAVPAVPTTKETP